MQAVCRIEVCDEHEAEQSLIEHTEPLSPISALRPPLSTSLTQCMK